MRKDISILADMGEWAAVGYFEALDENLPWPVPHGRAFRRLYENMRVNIPEGRFLVPAEPLENCVPTGMNDGNAWLPKDLIGCFTHDAGLAVNRGAIQLKKNSFPQHAAFIDDFSRQLCHEWRRFGGYTHSNCDYRRIVDEGFLSVASEVEAELAGAEAANAPSGERNLLLSLREYCEGVKVFHRHCVDSISAKAAESSGDESRRYGIMRDALGRAFLHPARNFYEGLLATHFLWMLDGCDSLGRLDQVLGPLWEHDLADGSLDLDFARSLLDELFQNFQRFNGWNLQIGGRTPDGKDGANSLTGEILEACRRNHLPKPNVAFRITSDTPEEMIVHAFDVLKDGSGHPALYNDDLYIRKLLESDLGLNERDARELSFGGCTETMIGGMSNVGSLEGALGLPNYLWCALNDGLDPMLGQIGPHTGRFADFKTFDDFMAVLKRQLQFAVDGAVANSTRALKDRFTQGDPKMCRTLFTRDCVRRRKSFEAGGARYNWTMFSFQGIATLIDSVMAIRKLVYEERKITQDDLMAALKADFNGYENIRQMLLAAPKYGNDIPEVDKLGSELIGFLNQAFYQHETPRGGRYLTCCIVFSTYGAAGKTLAATPDGRRSGAVLNDSAAPTAGRDVSGPTALIKSTTTLPLSDMLGTPVVNVRLSKNMLSSPEGMGKALSLLKSYFQLGGMQWQVSVASADEMRAAKKEPENWRNLIVRIGGFSIYFNSLPPEMQDSVIARTEISG